jgi:hypothetical protein
LRISVRLTAGLIALAMLVACGNEKSEPSPLGMAVGSIAKATVSRVKTKRSGGATTAAAPITRADIEKYNLPILRAVIASRGADALLTATDQKGDVTTWSTTDGTAFTLRNGVLIQTRGLGADLMSAQVPSVAQLSQNGGTHQRVYYFLGQDDQTTRRTYDCNVTEVGRETIVIFERGHVVRHVTEVCLRPQGKVTNEFWIEGSTVRKSRQWVSGITGHVDFERVVD